ncbi:hypothetical protein [uncultured Limosilactobacillus sp.]|uniref:hypothetical protein n=1 Tax=uncultured Limosilactobacillus sp. TaxID=2837629 RepID=UPI0025D14862|nr:hypothetical protein [uncultured Limosilactobacillus sp.]
MKTSKAQMKATNKWSKKNPDKKRLYRYRSYARKYVRDLASEEDLKELQGMINERLQNKD